MISGDSINLLFKMRGDSSQAREDQKKFREEVEKTLERIDENGESSFADFAQSIGLSAEQTAKLSGALPAVGAAAGIAAAGIALAAGAAIALGKTLFDITRQSAEAGAEIQRFSTLTGFSVQTVTALKIASEQAGTSIDEIEEVFESFVELMIEAGEGAEDAVKKVKSLGLDPQTAFQDLEGSFLKVLDKIREMPTQAGKAKVAMDGMGESGLNMVKVAAEMEGGTAAYIARLKEMGLVMDAEGIRKSKEFDRQLKEVGLQFLGVKNIIAREYLPIFLNMAKETANFLSRNQDQIKSWAERSADSIRGLIEVWKDLKQANENYQKSLIGLKELDEYLFGDVSRAAQKYNPGTSGTAAGVDLSEYLRKRGELIKKQQETLSGSAQGDYDRFINDEDERKKAAEKAEDLRKKRLEAELKSLDLDIELERTRYENYKKDLDNLLKAQGISLDTYRQDLFVQITKTEGLINAFYQQKINKLRERFSGKELENEIKAIDLRKLQTSQKFDDDSEQITIDVRERKIKSKEIEVNQLLNLEREKVSKELALTDLLFQRKEISEAEYLKTKAGLSEKILEIEKRGIDDQIAYLAVLLNEEAKIRRISSEEFLKQNDKYNELLNKSFALKAKIDAQKAANAAANEKFKTDILDSLQSESDATEEKRNKVFLDNERNRFESLIEFGKNRLGNLKEYLNFELGLIDIEEKADKDKLEREKENRLERIKGFEKEAELKQRILELYQQKALLSEEEFEKRRAEIKNQINPQIQNAEAGSFLGGLIGGLGTTIEDLQKPVDIMKTLGSGLANVFQNVASAVGDVVKNFVLFGNAGTSFRKFAAEIVATIAQMAVVQAVWEAAQGFAMLALGWFTGNPKFFKSATDHFIAAGVFAGIGGVAAVVGRGIAGDAFKGNQAFGNESSGAYGSTSQTGAESGQVYSSNREKQVYNLVANASQTMPETKISISDKSGMFNQFFKVQIEKGGMLRDTIKKVANS